MMMLYWTREDILEVLNGANSKTVARQAFLQRRGDDLFIRYRHRRLIVWSIESGYNCVTIDCAGDRDQPVRRILNRFVFLLQRGADRFYKQEGIWYVEIDDHIYEYRDGMQIIDAPQTVLVGIAEVLPETLVMFRWCGGEVTAMFPAIPYDEHGVYCKGLNEDIRGLGIEITALMEGTREALPGEYAILLSIIQDAGLNPRIIHRVQQSHHRERKAAAGVAL